MLIEIKEALVLIAFTWHYALYCGYISDDHATAEQRTDIIPDSEKTPKKEEYWIKVFNDGIFTHYITTLFWKLRLSKVPFAWHLANIIVHLANAYMLMLVLDPLIGKEVAVVASLFWAINPMMNQNVVWVSGRPYLYALFFSLLGMLHYENPFIFMPCYVLALTTNISIIFLPVVLKLIHPSGMMPNLYLVLCALVGLPFMIWKFNQRFTKALVLDRENFRLKPRKLNTLVRIYAYYVLGYFSTTLMGWYHEAGFRYNEKWEKFNIWTLVGYGITGFFMMMGWAGWWFLLGILPNANLYATNSFVQDRYLYFGSIGIAVICAPIMVANPVLLVIALTFYITKAYTYSRHLINDEETYRENWRRHPKSEYAVNNLAYFLIKQKRYEEARVTCLRGLEVNRMNKMLWYNLGVTWAATGNFQNDEGKFKFLRAIDCWKMALQVGPRWSKPAEDMKKLIKILVEKGVLTIHQKDATDEKGKSFTVDIPAFKGLKEEIEKGEK